MPDVPLTPVAIPLIAPRPDGTRVTVEEVVAVLARHRVAGTVRDGQDVSTPGTTLMTVAADDEGNVATWDGGLDRGMAVHQLAVIVAAELRTPVVSILEASTVAILPDGTEIETDENDPDPHRAAIVAAVQRRAGARAVHAYPSEDPMFGNALAKAYGAPLAASTVDGWTVFRTPDDTEPTERPGLVSRQQPFALRVEQNAEQWVVRGLVLTDQGEAEFVATAMAAPTWVHPDYPDDLKAVLLADEDAVLTAGPIDQELVAALRAATADPSTFVRSVMATFRAPTEVVRWAEGGEPGPDATTLAPRSVFGLWRDGMARERQSRKRARGERR